MKTWSDIGVSQISEEICAKEGVNNLQMIPQGRARTNACDKKILEEFSNCVSVMDIFFVCFSCSVRICPPSANKSTVICL